MNKYKRGDKHPIKELIFWQYHHPFYKETNGEVWFTKEIYEEKIKAHAKQTAVYKKKHPLMYIVSGTIQRDIQKYKTSKNDLIDIKFIEELLEKQNNKCYWFNIEMDINSSNKKQIRNPLKMTIDRLDCKKGYSKDNVVLCTYAANCGRGNCDKDEWNGIVEIIKNGLNGKKI